MSRHRLGGKTFDTCDDLTVGQVTEFEALSIEAGLHEPALEPGETPEDFAKRILRSLIVSRKGYRMLGCLLLPKGARPQDWSPGMAERTARYLRSLPSAEGPKVNALLLGMLVDFLESGLRGEKSSRSSTGQPGAESDLMTSASVAGAS